MANIFAPFGFQNTGTVTGQAPNFGQAHRLIAQANSQPIFSGDPVIELTTGYIAQAPTGGTGQIHGIFQGCTYSSVSRGGAQWWSPYWPGADANGDVTAFVSNHPESEFLVQTGNGGPATLSVVGANIGFQIGTGNTVTGQSGAYADFASSGTSSTLPFIVTRLIGDPPGAQGADLTTQFNWIAVVFNNQSFKNLTGV